MRKLAGRPGRKFDENWICRVAIAERQFGGNGPFTHKGEAFEIMYVLRSEENQKQIADEKTAFTVYYNNAVEKGEPVRLPPQGTWHTARPGDVVVDRALKTVYLVLPDGSHKRCDDPEARDAAIAKVKDQLDMIKAVREQGNVRIPVEGQ